MDGRGDRGESVAIIGMACRFPGARDPVEFHDLAVAGRDMFQPVAALPGRGRAKSQGGGYQRRAGNVREHAGQPDGTADARRGGSRPFRAGPAGAVGCGGAGNPARSVT